MSSPIYVPAAGRLPNPILLVGEAPGRDEARLRAPFVGPSGQEQDRYLARFNLSPRAWRRTNVVGEYREGNPDPTPEDIERWTPALMEEVAACRPRLVIAVGRFAARWFLGEGAELEVVHGMVHEAGAFDESLEGRAGGAWVLPIYHPALGFYDGEARARIAWDYEQVARAVKEVVAGREPGPVRRDLWAGREAYLDVGGEELADLLEAQGLGEGDRLALDTEGVPGRLWSVQVSWAPGTGMLLRCAREDFEVGVAAIQRAVDRGVTIVMHQASTPMGCMYDVGMAREVGLELAGARIRDTMYAAYLMRLEAQGLKALAWRWCGMRMEGYEEVVGTADLEAQVRYLERVVESDWPKPEREVVVENDGTWRLYTPQSVQMRARGILRDLAAGKRDKDGNPVDVLARWEKIDRKLRREAERELGRLPEASFDTAWEVDPERVLFYGARDADATLRLDLALEPVLEELDLSLLYAQGMEVLPVFESMQRTGMVASRRRVEELLGRVENEMWEIQSRLSHRYFDGRPFNPNSGPQTAVLLRRRGVRPEFKGRPLTTPTGMPATGKKAIEPYRDSDPAVSDLLDWRERGKIRDFFIQPLLERFEEEDRRREEREEEEQEGEWGDADLYTVRCVFKPTRTPTRRLAAEKPNLQQVPSRTELGKEFRACYVAPPGYVYGAWDLSSIEPRYAAHHSRDEYLCRLFVERRDVYVETASEIFGVRTENVDREAQRRPTKTAWLGMLYGLGGEGLLTQLRMMRCEGWDLERCEDMIAQILRLSPGIKAAIDETRRELEARGYVRDAQGMYRYLPGIWARDRGVVEEAVRMGFSHKIQGGAQGMIQRSMIALRPRIEALVGMGWDVRWCLQIHDEVDLMGEDDEELREVVHEMVMDALTRRHGVDDMRVPVEAEGHWGKSWDELK